MQSNEDFSEKDCISVKTIAEFQHSYTVIRGSGDKMIGYTLGSNLPYYFNVNWAIHHATKTVTPTLSFKGWRLMITNKEDSGWKPINTIYPTALEGDDAAIQEWRNKVVTILESIHKSC
jgi:hypothetical protein